MSVIWSARCPDWFTAGSIADVCFHAPVEEFGCNSAIRAADDDDADDDSDDDDDDDDKDDLDEDGPLTDEPFTIEEDDFFDENDFDDDFDDDFQEEYEELEADFGDDEKIPEKDDGGSAGLPADEDF